MAEAAAKEGFYIRRGAVERLKDHGAAIILLHFPSTNSHELPPTKLTFCDVISGVVSNIRELTWN